MNIWAFLFLLFLTVGVYFVIRNILSESVTSLKVASRYYNARLVNKLDKKAKAEDLQPMEEILKKDFWKDL